MQTKDLPIPQKFQSFALNRVRTHQLVAPKGMLSHFGLETLITSVAVERTRLLDIVERVTRTHRKILERKFSPELDLDRTHMMALELIHDAIEAEAATAEDLFDENGTPNGISTDEIAHFFPGDKVFELWFYSGWHSGDEFDKKFMADVWDFVIEHKMFGPMTHLDLVTKLGVGLFMSDKIPHVVRTAVLEAVLQNGEPLLRKTDPGRDSSSMNATGSKAFTAAKLLEVMTPTVLTQHIEISQLGRPIIELAKQLGWIKVPAVNVEVPKPEISALPPEALDSVVPPAPSTTSDGDPEVVVGATDTAAAWTSSSTRCSRTTARTPSEHPSLVDDDSDESTMVVTADDAERGSKKNKRDKSGPPPLQKR
jgi:hypothetical protein